jgi:phosphatidylserine/phosphatidylglycerophosphate/cardiolipin synthase-like enzyme
MRATTVGLVFFFSTCALPGAASGEVTFCDSAWENCRTELIRLIRAETRGIYTIQWYTRDTYIVGELIKKHRAGVPVRFIVDQKSESATRTGVLRQIHTMRDAGIPLREGPTKYVHAKAFIFVGQRTIQFGAPNLSQYEWMPNIPFQNYRNENNEFHYQATLADSLITIYEDMWESSPHLRDYANMTPEHRAPLNPIYPKDPRWSVQPMDAFSTRLVHLIDQESAGIDVNVLRFESESLANGLIRRHRAGIPVRVNTESAEYRAASRPMVSFILDTLWAAGVPLKWRAHSGNNHEKVGIFHGQRVIVRGSSNWSPGSDEGNTNIEINFFSNPLTNPDDLDAFAHFVPKFERRWSNLQYVDAVQVIESKWFVPQGPGSSTYLEPANASTVSTITPTLSFTVKWAHYIDLYYGQSSTAMIKYQDRMPVASNHTVNVTLPVLAAGSYYWRVVARTAANKTSTGPIWSFRVP